MKQSAAILMPDFRRLYGYGPEDTYCGSCAMYQEYAAKRFVKATGRKEQETYRTCGLLLIGREVRYDGDSPEWDEGLRTCSRYRAKAQ